MKGNISLALFLIVTIICGVNASGYEKIEIKHGMYEKVVEERFGPPELSEEMDQGFFPISRKKALYRIGESDYAILYFYSRRVNKITILSDMDYAEAAAMFAAGEK